MNAKHTPGTWESWAHASTFWITGPAAAAATCAERAVKKSPVCKDAPFIFIAAQNKTSPAIALGNTKEEAESNALLIAAAPDLLEAMLPFSKLLQEHHERLPDNQPIYGIGDSLITVGDMRRAVAAIAKATGEQ